MKRLAICLAVFLSVLRTAQADLLYTASYTSATQDVSASINLTTGDVTLTNNVQNAADIMSVLTGIQFQLTSGTGSLTSASGNTSTINDAIYGQHHVLITPSGTYTAPAATDLMYPNGSWNATSFIDLSVFGNGQPYEGIIGKDDQGGFDNSVGRYSAANSSIVGNGPHNPFVMGTASFHFDFSGVSGLKVDSVYFEFGTVPTLVQAIVDPPPGVPEPSSLALAGLGGIGLIVAAIRRRRTIAA